MKNATHTLVVKTGTITVDGEAKPVYRQAGYLGTDADGETCVMLCRRFQPDQQPGNFDALFVKLTALPIAGGNQ